MIFFVESVFILFFFGNEKKVNSLKQKEMKKGG